MEAKRQSNAETATPLGAPKLNTQKFVGGCTAETLNTARYTGVNWCVTITNDGAVSATDVTLRDLLPIGWTYQDGSTTGTVWPVAEPATSIVNQAQLVEWTIDDFEPTTIARTSSPPLPRTCIVR